jgi:hypothetical protein
MTSNVSGRPLRRCLSGSSSRQRRVVVEQRTRSVDRNFARPGERRDSPPCQSKSEWNTPILPSARSLGKGQTRRSAPKVERALPTHLDLNLHRVCSACRGLRGLWTSRLKVYGSAQVRCEWGERGEAK